MRYYESLAQFYNGQDWEYAKAQVTEERLKDGALYCEHCGKVILKSFNPSENNNKGAIVYHHKIYLTLENVNDASISINPANIAIVHWNCHNIIHKRFCAGSTINQIERKVYLITGAPCSGKTTFARERIETGDILLDVDDLWQTLSGQPRYIKPTELKPIVLNMRLALKDQIARGAGSWRNAYVIDSLPLATDRKREAERYKAHNIEIITMEASREECLNRLYATPNGRDIKLYESLINDYFSDYTKGSY